MMSRFGFMVAICKKAVLTVLEPTDMVCYVPQVTFQHFKIIFSHSYFSSHSTMSYNTEQDCATDLALSKLFDENVTISDEDKNKSQFEDKTYSEEDKTDSNEVSMKEVKAYTRKSKNTPKSTTMKKNPLRVVKNGKVTILFLVKLLNENLINNEEFTAAKEELYKGMGKN